MNLRNDRQSLQDCIFRIEVLAFDEAVTREAILNAICHRDYHLNGSVFIRQYSRRLEVVSPGGFPQGVTPENILDAQNPRNRRLAKALGRCGLVERAGQGMNLMFERMIRQSEPLPEFGDSTLQEVRLLIRGNVASAAFLRFMEQVGQETLAGFDTRDLLILDRLQREEPIPPELLPRLPRLTQAGVIETVGHGRGVRHLLSRRLYTAIGQRGTYTRRRGLNRVHNKALVLAHLKSVGAAGCQMAELRQVLPSLSRGQIKGLLNDLRAEGAARLEGVRRRGRWFYGQKDGEEP